MAFITCIQKEYYYKLILVVSFFLLIETIHGLKPFSLTVISFSVYYLIIPRIKHIFSQSGVSDLSFLMSFYLLFYIYTGVVSGYSIDNSILFIVNFIIDSLIIGFLI
ncbi:MAG: hypothetical protein U9Q33_07565 [Campylobacterota bacterium]|nr:hypothetical protein [Campylobacterota bacterium]